MNTTTFEIHATDVSTSHETDVFLLPDNRVDVLIWKAWTPCLLLLGGFGNIATIFVMRRIKGSNSSQQVILISLAVSDFCLLYTAALHRWIEFMFGVDVRTLHTLVCGLHIWLVYAINTTCAWLVTLVTVQRTLAVIWPHKMRMMCTVRRTWTVIVVIVAVACSLHFHFVLGMEVSAVHKLCLAVSAEYERFRVDIFHWIDMLLSSLLPAACLLVCDVILSLTLFRASSSSSVLAVHAIPSISSTQSNNYSRRKTASRTTVMILALSCTFLVLTLPVCVYQFFDDPLPNTDQTLEMILQIELIFAVTENLWYTNSAVNFLLYTFTGTRFRQEFLRWFRCAGTLGQSTSTGGGIKTAATGLRETGKKLSTTTMSDITQS